ncbi:hypothetical protein Amet_2439 [Alkaliphilus metalliredigens QYMF]|uniref:DUF5659 domain-containing protein n=1 Tax=Alkaliphilus metalliredigens (strain QYMF) TaxID=293826 RepID=A6TQX5_ALKMQ|nr:DUF5659 domain-containing protein [Alkaliphilus metalliredigens]ABR48593.1 hypothetical protein Amet_2439 [Alkaliphilus metalliredigens QYMF]
MMKANIKLTDKDLITYLAARGFEIVDTYKEASKDRSIVLFKNSKELDRAILDYANKRGDINIADYLATEKRVKNLFYANKMR